MDERPPAPVPGPDLRRSFAVGAAVAVVAGAAGWFVAGPPPRSAGLVPPACPASYARGLDDPGTRAGLPDDLVPIGPVSVRACRYSSSSGAVALERVLDPSRTTALAGLLDAPDGPVVLVDGAERAACRPGPSPVLLVFRYPQGRPLIVGVDAGRCRSVSTPVRAETGRDDVLRELERILK